MVGRDRRARRGNFRVTSDFVGSERRWQVRHGEDAIAGAPGGRALPLLLVIRLYRSQDRAAVM